MMTGLIPLNVFFDTSFILKASFSQDSDWQKVLLLSKERKLNLYTSRMVIEEWRTNNRDYLSCAVVNAKKALVKMHDEWRRNFLRKDLTLPIGENELPSEDIFESHSHKIVNQFLSDNLIIIREHHVNTGNQVWEKYFSWSPPFKDNDDRSKDANRQGRRKDIPDAWVIESILGLKIELNEIICLCRDGNIIKTLKEEGIRTFDNAEDILRLINSEQEPPLSSEVSVFLPIAPLPSSDSVIDVSSMNDGVKSDQPPVLVDSLLGLLQEKENDLLINILGFSQWFEPISKEELSTLLQQQGYLEAAIQMGAQRLVIGGLLKDTSTHYLCANKQASKQAAEKVKAKILNIIDRS